MQIISVLLAAILGLSYGHYQYGFVFSQNICLFAGITLIMPTLFKVQLRDVQKVWEYKSIVIKNMILNYLIFPAVAVGIGLLSQNFGIAAGVFLLSVLGGGGMVMHWIKKSGGDSSIGFILLFINLMLVSLSMLMLHGFGLYTSAYFDQPYENVVNMKNFAKAVIMLLIVAPFVASRLVMMIKPLQDFIEAKRPYISQISIFVIIFYLFGLQKSQALFELYEFEPELIGVAFVAIISFYGAVFFISKWMYRLDHPQENAAFWQSVTRYITLALVIATFSSSPFGISILLPLMMAYVIQIPFAILINKRIASQREKNE